MEGLGLHSMLMDVPGHLLGYCEKQDTAQPAMLFLIWGMEWGGDEQGGQEKQEDTHKC